MSGLLDGARQGRGGAALVEGEPGIGKSALLEEATRDAAQNGFQVLTAQGVRGASEVGFSGLHALLLPVLDRLSALPDRQRRAIETVFGTADGQPPEPLILQIAVLSLVEEAAATAPVLLTVEDLHWVDPSSAEAIAFLAPRLGAVGAALLATARTDQALAAAAFDTRVLLRPLCAEDAHRLVTERRPDATAAQRDRIVHESVGNPLALTELSVSTTPVLAARPARRLPMTRRLEQTFLADVTALDDRTRRALLVAAAGEDAGPGELSAALARSGLSPADLTPAERAGLGRLGSGFAFRHPLVSSSVYDSADAETRRAAHRALADVVRDEGRAAQHLAAATVGWDDDVAARLDESARRADARGARTEASAAWEAAAALTEAPGVAARRLAAAAETARQAGDVERALALSRRARPSAVDEATVLQLETTEWMLSQTVVVPDARSADGLVDVAVSMSDPEARLELLVFAAVRWYILQDAAPVAERIGDELARSATPDQALREIGLGLVQPGRGLDVDTALEAFRGPLRPVDGILLNCLAFAAEEARDLVAAERVWTAAEHAYHAAGRTGDEATALCGRASVRLLLGDVTGGMADASQAMHLSDQMGLGIVGAMAAAVVARARALRGEYDLHRELVTAAELRGGVPLFARVSATLSWARGIAAAGEGRDLDAVAEIEQTAANAPIALWAGADLAEPALRSGRPEAVSDWIAAAEAEADRSGSDHLRMLVLRSRALLADGPDAEGLFEQALAHASSADASVDVARTHLLYGEWLRRSRRILRAREHLRESVPVFRGQGLEPLLARASAELRAAGESDSAADCRDAASVLTPQELQISRLAATGLSNKAIADQVYLSHRTVGAHLHRAFAKLGISRRTQLPVVLENR
ncbi:hypothetical protein BJF88_07735 [Cellulosimicrobium sp. CUA-896]|nr:hypothetical protein BJF88_07735 [Cellulosimicrobium sp. CUA-896]